MPSISLCAQAACLMEVTARKLGDVNRSRDFAYVEYVDFLLSAVAIGPVLERTGEQGVGRTVLECIQRTRDVTNANTNLGVVLLLAPLACAGNRDGMEEVLNRLTIEDSILVYDAIRLAQPGALGKVDDQDVATAPTLPLRSIMAMAAYRDLIARQYSNGFHEVFEIGLPALLARQNPEEAILNCQLTLLAYAPDTLIARKYGIQDAENATRQARVVLESAWPDTEAGWMAWHGLDKWMREPGRERNPGTTADLVTACLFMALREGTMQLPAPRPWSAEHFRSWQTANAPCPNASTSA